MIHHHEPYWVKTKHVSTCLACMEKIPIDAEAFYDPNSRGMWCAADNCGKAADTMANEQRANEKAYGKPEIQEAETVSHIDEVRGDAEAAYGQHDANTVARIAALESRFDRAVAKVTVPPLDWNNIKVLVSDHGTVLADLVERVKALEQHNNRQDADITTRELKESSETLGEIGARLAKAAALTAMEAKTLALGREIAPGVYERELTAEEMSGETVIVGPIEDDKS